MSVQITTRGHKASMEYLSSLVASIDGDLDQALIILADDIISEARSNLQNNQHVYTGELNASIEITEQGKGYVVVGTKIPYAWYIEYGRGPVRPINAKFLHYFTKDGKEIFSKFSAATEPSPFLEPAVILKTQRFSDVVVEQVLTKPIPIVGNDQ